MSTAPVLFYDFQAVNSTIVPDITDHGFTGVIRGDATGGARMGTDLVFGESRSVLILTGNGGYLQLPDGAANNTNGFSVSFFCCIESTAEPGCVFSFGTDASFYLLATQSEEDPDSIILFPALTTGGRSQEQGYWKTCSVRKHQWFHMTITLDANVPSNASIYMDGILVGTFSHRRESALALSDAGFCCFGNGHFASDVLCGRFTEIRLYDCVLTESEAASLFSITASARFSLEQALLEPLFASVCQSDLILPTIGQYGCSIAWSSSSSLISADGHVVRPAAGEADETVLLTAHMTWQDDCCNLKFPVTVAALPTKETIVAQDLKELSFEFPNHIAAALTLPEKGTLGSTITWMSSNPAVLASDGALIRDEQAHEVLLTATASVEDISASRTFMLHILPAAQIESPGNSIRTTVVCHKALTECVSAQVSPADPAGIELTDTGLLAQNQARDLAYLHLIDADRMLYNFRKAFGVDTKKARPLGGWEEPAGLLRGHSTGHLLSALAYAYAYSHDEALKKKADYMIDELRSLQLLSKGDPAAFATACTPTHAAQSLWSKDPSCWGEGYLSAYSPDSFALLELFTPYATIWAPYYTLHKLLAGFLDNYRLCHNQTALDCACGIADWVERRLNATTAEQRARMWKMYIAGEYGGMNESLAALAQITGDVRYQKTAMLFDNPNIFPGLAKNEDTISGIHANQHIPQIIGSMAEYQAGGDISYYQIARNFWHLVVNHYLYSIGGTGRGEIFKEPDILAGNIEKDRNCETCAAYNLLKLAAMLYRYEPDCSDYMDYYERALLNQIAASQSPQITPRRHNGVTYMLPIAPGMRKEYSSDYDDFTCCHGTGMENHVKYPEQIYHIGPDSLYINLYVGSRLQDHASSIALSIDTSFPSDSATIRFEQTFRHTLKLRVPYWCKDTFCASFHQKTVKADKAGYLTISEVFAPGDTIEISMPFSVHLCYTPDTLEGNPVASVLYGPIVMVATDERTDWIRLCMTKNPSDAFQIVPGKIPELRYEDLTFIPMYQAHHMAYHTYFQILH